MRITVVTASSHRWVNRSTQVVLGFASYLFEEQYPGVGVAYLVDSYRVSRPQCPALVFDTRTCSFHLYQAACGMSIVKGAHRYMRSQFVFALHTLAYAQMSCRRTHAHR